MTVERSMKAEAVTPQSINGLIAAKHDGAFTELEPA